MAKNRFINTKFWSDSFVVELNPLDRYLFLYLLTNEHTNIAGIYELPLRVMAFETGLDKDMLPKMLIRLFPKVIYVDGWVYIPNFEKHQRVRGSKKIEIGIKNIKKEVPKEIFDKIAKISKKGIGYTYSLKEYQYPSNYSDSDLDIYNNINIGKATKNKNMDKMGISSIGDVLKDKKKLNPE